MQLYQVREKLGLIVLVHGYTCNGPFEEELTCKTCDGTGKGSATTTCPGYLSYSFNSRDHYPSDSNNPCEQLEIICGVCRYSWGWYCRHTDPYGEMLGRPCSMKITGVCSTCFGSGKSTYQKSCEHGRQKSHMYCSHGYISQH